MADLKELVHDWTKGSFAMRSGYYAGRPPSPGDLGPRHLEMIYAGIKKDIGVTEAGNFVRFVNKLNDLSASAFIVAFETFWRKGCLVIDIPQDTEDGLRLDAHGSALEAQAFGLIIEVMFGNRTSKEERLSRSDGIRTEFILKHLDEVPVDEQREMYPGPFIRW